MIEEVPARTFLLQTRICRFKKHTLRPQSEGRVRSERHHIILSVLSLSLLSPSPRSPLPPQEPSGPPGPGKPSDLGTVDSRDVTPPASSIFPGKRRRTCPERAPGVCHILTSRGTPVPSRESDFKTVNLITVVATGRCVRSQRDTGYLSIDRRSVARDEVDRRDAGACEGKYIEERDTRVVWRRSR